MFHSYCNKQQAPTEIDAISTQKCLSTNKMVTIHFLFTVNLMYYKENKILYLQHTFIILEEVESYRVFV